MVDLSAYDMKLEEDPEKNRMQDALDLFGFIANHPLLNDLRIILLLNKKDLFEKKVKKRTIGRYFPDYRGTARNFRFSGLMIGNPHSASQSISFFERKFRSLCTARKGPVYSRVSCAIDTKLMKTIIQSIL